MKFFIYIYFSLILLACSSQKYATDKYDANYQSGQGFAPLLNSSDGGAGTAALAAVITGISLASNRDYYKNIAITGKCVCLASSSSNLSIPCGDLTIALMDSKGKEITQTQTRNDEFAFRVPKDKGFRLKINTPKYKVSDVPNHDLFLGDDVVIHLSQKK